MNDESTNIWIHKKQSFQRFLTKDESKLYKKISFPLCILDFMSIQTREFVSLYIFKDSLDSFGSIDFHLCPDKYFSPE